jgi:hypothetical protein
VQTALPWTPLGIAAAILAAGIYLVSAAGTGGLGFPLDDAWIHQTYARNLAQSGSLAFVPGQPSAGSTSPLWSALLAIGYLLGIDSRAWAYTLGIVCLVLTGWLASRAAARLFPGHRWAPLLTGLFCVLEWHLVWAAVSGMETLLFTALSLLAVDRAYVELEQPNVRGQAQLGLLVGLLPLVRPEGIVLGGLIVLLLLAGRDLPWQRKATAAAVTMAVAGLVLAPYLAFNLRTAGALFPNTFYAKQAEYQLALSLPERILQVVWPAWVGAQVMLAPGVLAAAAWFLHKRSWSRLAPLAWWACLVGAYALRLPVTYQHGRYLMPGIPWLVVYGVGGTGMLLRPTARQAAIRLVSRALPIATAVLVAVFLGLGARAYRTDVGFIEGEMVQTARWVAGHTAPGTQIAAHDIGAIGYFAERPILDLAGLVTPAVIPFITDADQLLDFMLAQGAHYAVFFPDFSPTYRELAVHDALQEVYRTEYAWTRTQGLANMAVYRIRSPKDAEQELR